MSEVEAKRRRGRPSGIPREGKFGTGVKTKLVRVPETIADNIPNMLAKFKKIKLFVDNWQNQIEAAAVASTEGKSSPLYDKTIEMLLELRQLAQ